MKVQNTENILRSLEESFRSLQSGGRFTEAQSIEARQEALEQLVEKGFPTTQDEFWKYTDLNKHLKRPWQLISAGGLSERESQALAGPSASSLCFFNGVFTKGASDWNPELEVKSLESELPKDFMGFENLSAFGLLNVAYQRDRVRVRVPKGVRLEHPVKVSYLLENLFELPTESSSLCNSWLELVVEEGAEIQLIEDFFQLAGFPTVTNNHLQITLEPNARCEHLRLINGEEGSQHFGQSFVCQQRDSFYSVTTMSAGSSFVRQSCTIEQVGENAESLCNGLYLCDGAQHSDHRVVMRHLKPHGMSRQLFKGVLKGRSRSVFNGKIYIEKQAQKIDSNQLNNNLILSPGAEADSKPELEVYADDVKANHGSAIGRLDEDQLFYLMSRCLSRSEAVQHLARGFVRDVSLQIRHRDLSACAESWISRQFGEFQKSIEQEAGVGGESV